LPTETQHTKSSNPSDDDTETLLLGQQIVVTATGGGERILLGGMPNERSPTEITPPARSGRQRGRPTWPVT
jgi:hypothetical protein